MLKEGIQQVYKCIMYPWTLFNQLHFPCNPLSKTWLVCTGLHIEKKNLKYLHAPLKIYVHFRALKDFQTQVNKMGYSFILIFNSLSVGDCQQ